MNAAGQQLFQAAVTRFGGRAFSVEVRSDDTDGGPGSITLTFTHPRRQAHQLQVVQRGNTFEVAFTDSDPPGPAERLFAYSTSEELPQVVAEVMEFLGQLFSGQVIVWRERLGPVTRLLRGFDTESLLWFAMREELTPPKHRRLVRLYDWTSS